MSAISSCFRCLEIMNNIVTYLDEKQDLFLIMRVSSIWKKLAIECLRQKEIYNRSTLPTLIIGHLDSFKDSQTIKMLASFRQANERRVSDIQIGRGIDTDVIYSTIESQRQMPLLSIFAYMPLNQLVTVQSHASQQLLYPYCQKWMNQIIPFEKNQTSESSRLNYRMAKLCEMGSVEEAIDHDAHFERLMNCLKYQSDPESRTHLNQYLSSESQRNFVMQRIEKLLKTSDAITDYDATAYNLIYSRLIGIHRCQALLIFVQFVLSKYENFDQRIDRAKLVIEGTSRKHKGIEDPNIKSTAYLSIVSYILNQRKKLLIVALQAKTFIECIKDAESQASAYAELKKYVENNQLINIFKTIYEGDLSFFSKEPQ